MWTAIIFFGNMHKSFSCTASQLHKYLIDSMGKVEIEGSESDSKMKKHASVWDASINNQFTLTFKHFLQRKRRELVI